MNKKCIGCGVVLQDNNILLDGYTNNLSNKYCMRCFKMKNYGEYTFSTKSNKEYEKILKVIGESRSLVLYVVDVMSIPKNVCDIKKYLKFNDIILVLNKKDILPFSTKDEKIINYFKTNMTYFKDIIVISAVKNYNLDLLMSYINKYKTDKNVYVVGNTNAGKSTLINKIIKNYTIDMDECITISSMPSTTLDLIKIKIKDYYIIDTPGLVDSYNFLNYIDQSYIKKISLKKEINPITYQIKENESLIIDNIFRIDYLEGDKNSFTFFIPNSIEIVKINSKRHDYLTNYENENINIRANNDLVIDGLGFIKIANYCKLRIYKINKILLFTRDSFI